MKKYIITLTDDESGEKIRSEAKNEGFNALELLGFFTAKAFDIYQQTIGNITPDIEHKRTVIVPKKGKEQP
jgi:hypothetical protein